MLNTGPSVATGGSGGATVSGAGSPAPPKLGSKAPSSPSSLLSSAGAETESDSESMGPPTPIPGSGRSPSHTPHRVGSRLAESSSSSSGSYATGSGTLERGASLLAESGLKKGK